MRDTAQPPKKKRRTRPSHSEDKGDDSTGGDESTGSDSDSIAEQSATSSGSIRAVHSSDSQMDSDLDNSE